MAERLTVVFDDPELYRRLKIWAAEHGVPVKRVVEDAIVQYLGPVDAETDHRIDWAAFDRWQAEVKELDAHVNAAHPFDIEAAREQRGRALVFAEDRTRYEE